VYTFLGSYPFCYALAYVGYRLGEHWHSLEGTFRKFDILIGAVLLAGGVWWVRRHLSGDEASPGGAR
jgi:membrane protein DedA with SNARE-associated domain